MTSVKTILIAAVALHWTASQADQLVWHSGFETGFPGQEWLPFDDGAYSARGVVPDGRSAAWTIVNRRSGEPVFSGHRAYKGWILRRADKEHRAYPVIHVDIPTPIVNTFMVYLDIDYELMHGGWVHFGGWGNFDPSRKSGRWALHTMAVRDKNLEFAHTSPFHGSYIGPVPQPEFPLRQWVRFSVYILYQGATGLVQVWQDGVPMLRAAVSGLREHPGTNLRTAHWGMYASARIDHGIQYNDDIAICTLDAPLTDLVTEPVCRARRASAER
jgi:hypothetical protein